MGRGVAPCSYSVYFNRRHGRCGHLFQGRFKGLLIEKESHLLELSRYIHLNPVRARMVARPQEHPWSSCATYLGQKPKYDWVNTDWTLAQFGNTERRARGGYRRFMAEGIERDFDDPAQAAVAGAILGRPSFVEWVREQFLHDRPLSAEQPGLRWLRAVCSVEDVIQAAAAAMGVDDSDIRPRGRHGNDARDMAIYMARRHCGLSNVRLGAEFGGVTGSNVTHACRRFEGRLREDSALAKRLGLAEARLSATHAHSATAPGA